MRARVGQRSRVNAGRRHTMTTLTTSTTTRVVRRRWTTAAARGNRAMRAARRGAVAMDGVEAIPRRKGARQDRDRVNGWLYLASRVVAYKGSHSDRSIRDARVG